MQTTASESADIPPSFIERRQTLIPAVIMDTVPIIIHPQGNIAQ